LPSLPKPEKSLKQSTAKQSTTQLETIEVIEVVEQVEVVEVVDVVEVVERKESANADLHDLGLKLKEKNILWDGWATFESDNGKKVNQSWDDFQIHPDGRCDGYGEDLQHGEFEIHGHLTVTSDTASLTIRKYYDNNDMVYEMEGNFKPGGIVAGTWVYKDTETGKVT
jgi:hypothetical protein